MKSVMQHNFARTPSADVPRSSFNRSHSHKTTFDGGYLVPILLDEVMPGDTFNLNCSVFCRFTATALERPVMDNAYLDTHFWFIETQQVWPNFKKMMGEQANPADSIDYTIPTTTAPAGTGVQVGEPAEYMGVRPGVASILIPNTLPLRCYNYLWNFAYRDENIQDSVVVDLDDGPDTYTDYDNLLRRGKRFDRYTACLPEPQKGDPVQMSLGTSANIELAAVTATSPQALRRDNHSSLGGDWIGDGNGVLTASSIEAVIDPRDSLYADLSTALGPTVGDMRDAVTMQQFMERDARGGTRLSELIYSHFGVVHPDENWRPVYLGGGSSPVNIHSVAGTNQIGTTTTAPGQLSSYGTIASTGHSFTKSFSNWGYIIGLASVRADLTYQQGLPKLWSRSNRFDFYYPTFQNLGEQPVYTRELFVTNTATDDDVFGYLPYGDEWRTKESVLSGLMRSDVAGTLDNFHYSQDFAAAPTLDTTFIQDDPPFDRVIAVTTEPHFLADFYFRYICARPLPTHSVPGLQRF